jgi:uncharacterized protein YqjF (DUF2071 family)
MKSWIIEQQWNHVLFLNWKVDAIELQKHVPFQLDRHEGSAIVSVVPFYMDEIRFPFIPALPAISRLWELNLRTYVVHNGVPGIYFFTLDTSHSFGNWIAKQFFKLPYRYAQMSASVQGEKYRITSVGARYTLSIEAVVKNESVSNELQRWITERYHLFLNHQGRVFRGDVHHEPWKTQAASLKRYGGNFEEMAGLNLNSTPNSAYYARRLKVRFSRFVRVF